MWKLYEVKPDHWYCFCCWTRESSGEHLVGAVVGPLHDHPVGELLENSALAAESTEFRKTTVVGLVSKGSSW